MKYKVGQSVRYVSKLTPSLIGKRGTVTYVMSGAQLPYSVTFSNTKNNPWWCYESELAPANDAATSWTQEKI